MKRMPTGFGPTCLVASLVLAGAAFLSGPTARALAAETELKTQQWENSDEDFARFGERIAAYNGRNLLARRGVLVLTDQGEAALLTDGYTGERGGQGRVFVNGQPTTITYYLGEPKTITEIGVLTFNIDGRSNQDYEARWANNSAKPGVEPKFRDQADLTTGEKVLGADRGGFHTSFARADGSPLAPEKVDWIQFKIWRTYNLKAGEPAKTDKPSGGTAVIELEVLGTKEDVVVPTPEEIAHREALRDAPARPEFVQRDTWQETLIASREAIAQWEFLHDKLAMFDGGVRLGPWHLLGPLPPNSPLAKEIRGAERIDLDKAVADESGQSLGWKADKSLVDWQPHDLAAAVEGGGDKSVFLCREMTFERAFDRREFAVAATADSGSLRWLPQRRGLAVHRPFGLVQGANELTGEPGQYQLLLELRGGKEGKYRFCFMPQPGTARPGAGDEGSRVNRQRSLNAEVREGVEDPRQRDAMDRELRDEIWGNPKSRSVEGWVPGFVDAYLPSRYEAATRARLERIAQTLACETGVKAQAIGPVKPSIAAWLDAFRQTPSAGVATPELRRRYQQACAVEEAVDTSGRVRSMRLSVEDQRETFADRYPKAGEYLARIDRLQKKVAEAWPALLAGDAAAPHRWFALSAEVEQAGTEILLSNPLLAFDKLLLVRGHSSFASNWGGPNSLGSAISVLSPVRPDGELTDVYQGRVSDMDLHWNAQKLLFSDGGAVWEVNVDGTGLRRVSAEDPPVTHYDACYLPDGKVMCVSNACEQAVPCTGGANVGNLHVMDADGSNERRVTFDQDHDWNPTVMHDGRVLYTRWEYTDTPHYFSRLLFRMNPDGTGQMEYYGSNSYWPNAMYWPRPIPGSPTAIVCVVSGHHGVSRVGELLILDPAKGRHEADGVVQRIPGYGQPVEPTIKDQLVSDVWPRFAAPYPLAEPETNRGAGRYFLACVQQNQWSGWNLCLVDVFDNVTPILKGGYMTPIPLRPRVMPPAIPSHIEPRRKEATVYVADIYSGDGLKGYPRGSIKALRVGSHHYRFAGNGDTAASSLQGGWDVKKILGTVPVSPDGSALFRVPANTPIFIQPLDENGQSQQVMRSWFTAMPGEVLSCIGCHEKQNAVPPSRYTVAANGQRPSEIKPWYGPTRGFSFDREVQPVLDRRCVGCHNGQPYQTADGRSTTIDFRAKRLHEGFEGPYSPAYVELQRYVRRAGYEADYHLQVPSEFEADTSALVQMLKKGHYSVELTREEWDRLITWIDFNIPYPVNWRESHRPPKDEQVARRSEYKARYAGIDDHDEDPLPLPPIAKFEPPRPAAAPTAAPKMPQGWPLPTDAAVALQKAAGPVQSELDLGDGVKLSLVLVPAGRFVMGATDGCFADELPQSVVSIDRPFYIGRFEVTNRQYAQFDGGHDSAYVDGRWKDRTTRGTPINQPDAPVVRVTWNEAMAFCEWLSQKTGRRVTLPTEAQWEWACRAGTPTAFSVGDLAPGMKAFANVADASIANWNHGRGEPGYNDGVSYTGAGGRYQPNAWGLCDMHGNVAEWCLSGYRPYPYNPADGRDDPRSDGRKVVRGGSWNDTLRYATSASRWRYQPYQSAYTVGFRLVVPLETGSAVAAAQ